MGSAALKLHFTLSVIGAESTMSSSTSPWTESDRDTFDAYCELENSFNLVEPHADVDGSDVVALAHKVQHLNASLPFREGERLWLIEAERQVSRDGFDFTIYSGAGRLGVARLTNSLNSGPYRKPGNTPKTSQGKSLPLGTTTTSLPPYSADSAQSSLHKPRLGTVAA
jgi:hypothetical protein